MNKSEKHWSKGKAEGHGHIPAHKQAADHGHEYPAVPYPEEYEPQTAKEVKGAARKAKANQIADTARPAKKK